MTDPDSRPTRRDRMHMALRDRALHGKAAKFAIVGLVNSALDYGVFVLAFLHAGWPIVAANTAAWAVAVTGSYVLNCYFTFAAETGRVLRLKDYVGFVGSGVAGFLANTLTVLLASFIVPVLVAKLIAIGVSFLVNFSLSHLLVFPARRTPDAKDASIGHR
jgi:putative flippase GtrA